MIRAVTVTCFVLLLFLLPAPQAWSAPAADQLLPQTTKGFLSIPDVQEFRRRWSETQLGKLCADPVMQPFAQDLQRQIRDKLLNGSFSVALTWDELFDVCGGELCVGGDSAGQRPQGTCLGADPGRYRSARGGRAGDGEGRRGVGSAGSPAERSSRSAGQELVTQQLPRRRGEVEAEMVIRFLVEDLLVIGNHEATCVEILRAADQRHAAGRGPAVTDGLSPDHGPRGSGSR